uniref:vegetative cell wall protein gp1-like n=1 Tax=Odobenus rosmarus divergens TaxID=9708 RepID=UPI00063C6418|nr:PREDICTED: vegetative cell wall protein gp1-like [Odobenus rosmarus divergens]
MVVLRRPGRAPDPQRPQVLGDNRVPTSATAWVVSPSLPGGLGVVAAPGRRAWEPVCALRCPPRPLPRAPGGLGDPSPSPPDLAEAVRGGPPDSSAAPRAEKARPVPGSAESELRAPAPRPAPRPWPCLPAGPAMRSRGFTARESPSCRERGPAESPRLRSGKSGTS